jgi:hypothetical protein
LDISTNFGHGAGFPVGRWKIENGRSIRECQSGGVRVRSRLLERIKRLEQMQKLAKPSIFRSGCLKRLPEDYVGERHIVIVKREPTELPNVERCRFEERPGPGPPDLDDSSLTVYLTEPHGMKDSQPTLEIATDIRE